MVATEFIKARLSPELKARVKALAELQLLTESAWLKHLVIRELGRYEVQDSASTGVRRVAGAHRPDVAARNDKGLPKPISVRLRDEDRLLLEARAAARGLRPATYLSVLARSHMRSLAPLPKDELLALRRSIEELASIGRNINQLAKVANRGGGLPASLRDEFRAMLRVCVALRDNTTAVLSANATSWETGRAYTDT